MPPSNPIYKANRCVSRYSVLISISRLTGFTFILNRPFTEKSGLLPPDEQTTPFEVCGIGGGSKTRIGTLESLRLGSADVRAPVTLFSQAAEGNLSRADFDGLIGKRDLTPIQCGV